MSYFFVVKILCCVFEEVCLSITIVCDIVNMNTVDYIVHYIVYDIIYDTVYDVYDTCGYLSLKQ